MTGGTFSDQSQAASTADEEQLLKDLAARHGFELIAPHMAWRHQPFFKVAAQEGEKIPGIPLHRCFILQSALQGLGHVRGDVVECGTRFGRSAYFMLSACEGSREFHLFDSFEGLSEPTEEDLHVNRVKPVARKGKFNAPESTLLQNLSRFSGWKAYKGWIPSRFGEIADRDFAFAHIDVDLYEPTRDSLDFLFPRMAPGGLIVCDDYGSDYFPGARRAMDEVAARERATLVELPTGQALLWKSP